ncbi:unnamed protein product [Meloidogyne enterolobii]|uniref:Uncharacterized protein n=1 Tax=Meloidogyne enterolobii TaxID=390850 RepID=A0ACB1ATL7_MELEN
MVIYLIYLYEQKRNEVESEKYKWKIDELRELAKNIQNIELEFYEQQNLGDLQGYINGFWSISLVEEKNAHYFYNELLKINFHFNWPSFTFKQSVHDPSYKPTPLGSGVQSVAGSGRSGLASGQRSGQDSGHIKFEDEEEEEEGAKEDEEEEDSDDEEDDQPGPSTTAVQHGQEHGDEIIEEGQQPGWQVGYPPQWAGNSIYNRIRRELI